MFNVAFQSATFAETPTHQHIPVDSSAARMPLPGATILWAMSCSSFFCSGVSAGYWWVMVAERERNTHILLHYVQTWMTAQGWPHLMSLLSAARLYCYTNGLFSVKCSQTGENGQTPTRWHLITPYKNMTCVQDASSTFPVSWELGKKKKKVIQ